MNYLELLGSLFGVVDKIMSAMPNYEQRKRKEYFDLKKRYLDEITREDGDDNLADNIRDELQLFIEAFAQEIQQENLQVLQKK